MAKKEAICIRLSPDSLSKLEALQKTEKAPSRNAVIEAAVDFSTVIKIQRSLRIFSVPYTGRRLKVLWVTAQSESIVICLNWRLK